MSAETSIEWTDKTWNPVRGCSLVSEGCRSCYAMKQAHRFSGEGKPYHGLTELGPKGPRWTGKVHCVESELVTPLHWRKPRRIFVNSMSDLFHEDVPDAFIDRVFAVMALAPQHTFQILTKRAERMRAYMQDRVTDVAAAIGTFDHKAAEVLSIGLITGVRLSDDEEPRRMWPLRNVWLGVSVENQHFADERIPLLLQTPAAVRFISAEPLLGPVDLEQVENPGKMAEGQRYLNALKGYAWEADGSGYYDVCSIHGQLDWVIVGGESGPGARPFDLAWGRSIIEQCKAAGVPVFVKQLGAKPFGSCVPNGCGLEPHSMKFKHSKAGDPNEWPDDLHVREFPTVRA